MSRRHARIERRPEGWTVVDQGSANGTFVDSQRIIEGAIADGQELRFGAIAYRVELTGGDDDIGATIVSEGLGPGGDRRSERPALFAASAPGVDPARRRGPPPLPPERRRPPPLLRRRGWACPWAGRRRS